jgi:hypothetical protein
MVRAMSTEPSPLPLSPAPTLLGWQHSFVNKRAGFTVPFELRAEGGMGANTPILVSGDSSGTLLVAISAHALPPSTPGMNTAFWDQVLAHLNRMRGEMPPQQGVVPVAPAEEQHPKVYEWSLSMVDGKTHLTLPEEVKELLGLVRGKMFAYLVTKDPKDGSLTLLVKPMASPKQAIDLLQANGVLEPLGK